MQTKLTLRIDDQLIIKAKEYAESNGKSLSQMVSDYFSFINRQQNVQDLPPITKALQGVLSDSKVEKESYEKYLEEKYTWRYLLILM